MTTGDKDKLLDQIATQLSEHFSSVQIIATTNQDGLSCLFTGASGSWYERMGAMQELNVRNDEMMREHVRGRE